MRNSTRLPPSRPVAFVEPLENRQLLSADFNASFASPLPAAFRPADQQKVTVRLTNQGDARSVGVSTRLYASADDTLDDSDILLSSVTKTKGVKAGKATNLKLKFRVPGNIADGNYRLIAHTDDLTGTAGTSGGNIAASATTVSIQQPHVDLGVSIIDQPDAISSVDWYGNTPRFEITTAVFNTGNIVASTPVSVTVYIADASVADSELIPIAVSPVKNLKIKPGTSKVLDIRGALPSGTAIGSYRLIAEVDPANSVVESDDSNNRAVSPTPVSVVNVPIGRPPHQDHHHHYDDYSYYYYGGGYYYYEPYYYGGGYYYEDVYYGDFPPPYDDYVPPPDYIPPPVIDSGSWDSSGGDFDPPPDTGWYDDGGSSYDPGSYYDSGSSYDGYYDSGSYDYGSYDSGYYDDTWY